jgi:hypothetical protein
MYRQVRQISKRQKLDRVVQLMKHPDNLMGDCLVKIRSGGAGASARSSCISGFKESGAELIINIALTFSNRYIFIYRMIPRFWFLNRCGASHWALGGDSP